jgi:CRISPR/Cas system CSM-associated protein Csm5 (group 7 of RAMP superfamily)
MLKLHFETITPLFIGSGEVLEKDFHYKIEDAELKKYNENEIVKDLAMNEVFDFKKGLTVADLHGIIKARDYKETKYFDYSVGLAHSFNDHINNTTSEGKDEVHEFVNSDGKFYIPGSSIKGALCTVLGLDKLGISTSIKERFVIHDTSYLDPFDFLVAHYERPPYVNLITMTKGSKFEIVISKSEGLSKDKIESSVSNFFNTQISKAISELTGFNAGHNDIALPMQNLFEDLQSEYKNSVIMNIGFGGGSWFKIQKGNIPKFTKVKNTEPEIPLTTYHYSFKKVMFHIGWCKLEVEECY